MVAPNFNSLNAETEIVPGMVIKQPPKFLVAYFKFTGMWAFIFDDDYKLSPSKCNTYNCSTYRLFWLDKKL